MFSTAYERYYDSLTTSLYDSQGRRYPDRTNWRTSTEQILTSQQEPCLDEYRIMITLFQISVPGGDYTDHDYHAHSESHILLMTYAYAIVLLVQAHMSAPWGA